MVARLLQARIVPDGLTYLDDLLSADEERMLLDAIDALEFDDVVMRR